MSTEATPATQTPSATAESKLEKPNERGRMCKDAEEAIATRANNNDQSLVDAIIQDPHSDFVCIPVSYLAGLKELADFAPKLEAAQREKLLVSVLESSEHLKTMKDKDGKIIIRTEYKRNPRNTLLMHNVAAEAKESDLRELFLSIPTAASVSFKKDVNSCWLATFDTEANAVATHSALVGKKLTVKDSVISIGLRSTRFVRATPATTTPAQPATSSAQPGSYNGMRQQMPQNMRAQYLPQQYWMAPVPQFWVPPYYVQQQQQQRGQHQPWMAQQQKPRPPRGGGHQRYQNPPVSQQQPRAMEQAPAPASAGRAAGDAAAAAATPAAAATTAPATAMPQQPQQQARENPRQNTGRGGRNYRNRNRGAGGNRGHGGQSGAAPESATEGAAAEQHSKHQRQSAGAERQEQPAKPQKKPSADSFPPLA